MLLPQRLRRSAHQLSAARVRETSAKNACRGVMEVCSLRGEAKGFWRPLHKTLAQGVMEVLA